MKPVIHGRMWKILQQTDYGFQTETRGGCGDYDLEYVISHLMERAEKPDTDADIIEICGYTTFIRKDSEWKDIGEIPVLTLENYRKGILRQMDEYNFGVICYKEDFYT